MIKRREKPDGLPYRVYERFGVNKYSIGYKLENGKWAFKSQCSVHDQKAIAKLKADAIQQAAQLLMASGHDGTGGVVSLINSWFEWQEKLPPRDPNKRAASTIKENEREAANLKKSFGHLEPHQITIVLGYEYLDACAMNDRPAKGNKEIALFQVILEWAVRKNIIQSNPLRGIRKNKTVVVKRYVTDIEIFIAQTVGRKMGGSCHIVAMALKTAWLCLRRSVEVRSITMQSITEAGIVWQDGKTKNKTPVLVEWTKELKDTIDEVQTIKRNHVAGTMYLFGNMRGQKYTKGGWKSILDDLMRGCVKYAEENNLEFKPFSLQDCRPKGASDKLIQGHTDVQDAMNHTSDKLIRQVYDRRQVKKATPVR